MVYAFEKKSLLIFEKIDIFLKFILQTSSNQLQNHLHIIGKMTNTHLSYGTSVNVLPIVDNIGICVMVISGPIKLGRVFSKLYCEYKYKRPCMINRILGLKQPLLQVNGHAWFLLHRLRWTVRNGKGATNSKLKYMSSPAGFEPTLRRPRQVNYRSRSLEHAGKISSGVFIV